MDSDELVNIARSLVVPGKGLLAIDESTATCNKRFAMLSIAQSVEMRPKYRELIITTSGLAAAISGVILYDETILQSARERT